MTTGDTFLVVGESVVDRVRTADGRVTAHPGGSPANVALGLGRLGRPVSFLTELGPDTGGDAVRAHLRSAGVRVCAAPTRSTPTATAELDGTGAARYEFDIRWELAPQPVEPGAGHVHAGSIAAYLTPGADTVEEILRAGRTRATVSLDPNIRPMLLGDHDAVLRRTARLLALSDVVKASDEDLAWLHPGGDPVTVAREWLDLGPALVVVTLGAHGSVAVTPDGVVHLAPVAVQVVDTVGAGDSFMAALLDGLATAGLVGPGRRDALRRATTARLRPVLERAARAAAITVGRAGAQPPTSSELDAPSS
jgi:fructokinase